MSIKYSLSLVIFLNCAFSVASSPTPEPSSPKKTIGLGLGMGPENDGINKKQKERYFIILGAELLLGLDAQKQKARDSTILGAKLVMELRKADNFLSLGTNGHQIGRAGSLGSFEREGQVK